MTAWWDPAWDDERSQQNNEEFSEGKDENMSIPAPCSSCGNLNECLSGRYACACMYADILDKTASTEVNSKKAFVESENRDALNGCRGIFVGTIITAIIIAVVLYIFL